MPVLDWRAQSVKVSCVICSDMQRMTKDPNYRCRKCAERMLSNVHYVKINKLEKSDFIRAAVFSISAFASIFLSVLFIRWLLT